MKKLILALVALAFAFAISSCCDQSHCPSNMKCGERNSQRSDQPPTRWVEEDQQLQPGQQQERQHRRW